MLPLSIGASPCGIRTDSPRLRQGSRRSSPTSCRFSPPPGSLGVPVPEWMLRRQLSGLSEIPHLLPKLLHHPMLPWLCQTKTVSLRVTVHQFEAPRLGPLALVRVSLTSLAVLHPDLPRVASVTNPLNVTRSQPRSRSVVALAQVRPRVRLQRLPAPLTPRGTGPERRSTGQRARENPRAGRRSPGNEHPSWQVSSSVLPSPIRSNFIHFFIIK